MSNIIYRIRFILSKIWNRKGFVRNVGLMAGSVILGQAVMALASPILTRLYTPDDLGTYSIFMSLVMILTVVANWRYEYAIMIPNKNEDAMHLLTLSFLIAILMSSLVLIVVVVSYQQLAQLLGITDYAQWLLILPLFLLFKGLYQAANYWFARNKQFGLLAVAGISRPIVTVGSQIGTAFLTSAGAGGLIFGAVAGETLAAGILSTGIRKNFRRIFPNSRFWVSTKDNIYRFKNFPLYTAPYSFAGICSKRLPFLLLGIFATLNEVGLFAIAMKFTRLPVTLVSNAIKPVFFQKAATELKSGHLERLVIKVLTLEMVLATPVLVFFLFNARWIFGIIFGDVWANAGIYATWLAVPAFMALFASWLDRIYDVTSRQRLALSMEVIYDILSISLFGLSLVWLKSVEWAVGLYSIATAIYYVVRLVVTFRVAMFTLNALLRIGALFLGIISIAGAMHWIMVTLLPRTAAITIFVTLMGSYYVYLAFKFGKNQSKPFS